ncbi:uncharacterized protein LOC132738636 [Ruditapes philippinarum]|uniref:uncharacterized protein LOC132738636 n=1 Tax=Ruditapes philippinarum TaxID=129788 RepID=UPI00295BF9DD|nr:uncharacterized protein LOC132738636 [Ruditapes philippinarum]
MVIVSSRETSENETRPLSLKGMIGQLMQSKMQIFISILANVLFLHHACGKNHKPKPTDVDATAYTFALTVVDSLAHADKTTLDLGESAKLKFAMTIDTYESNMDFAGARVTNCIVDKVAAFNSPAIKFIDGDGCFLDVDIFENMNTNVGFVKDVSSTLDGNIKTYIAYSPKFEMSAFTNNPVDAANALYFRCDVTLCMEDSDTTTAGQCGAAHCSRSSRRKRDAHERSGMFVEASVNITKQGTNKDCIKCSETTTFKLSIGVLGTITAIVFWSHGTVLYRS